MSNIDPRGIPRGRCTKCDCSQYEYSETSGKASCAYCECPAPAHEKIDGLPQQLTESRYVYSFTPSKMGGLTAEVSKISTHSEHTHTPALIVVPHDSDLPPSSQVMVLKPQENLLEDILKNAEEEINSDDVSLPNALPDSVIEALKQKNLDAKHRSEICRSVVNKLLEEGKASNKHLEKAAKKIRVKFSPMKRGTDPEGKALLKKLMVTRNRKIRGPPSKSSNSTASAPLSGIEAREAMIQDWAANKRSVTLMKPYLESTRILRNKQASKMKSLNLLVDYPALTNPQLLLHEFAAMGEVQLPVSVMRENWLEKLPHFRKYLSENNIYRIDDDFSIEQQTVIVLENLHRMPLWCKNAKLKRGQQIADNAVLENRASRVLEIFPENTPIAEARPNAKDPLRLSAIGQAMDSLNFFAFADSEPIFTTENPIEAILLLLGTYWVFHLDFGVANKLPVLFLAACILGPVKARRYIARNDKFLDLCRDHFNMVV